MCDQRAQPAHTLRASCDLRESYSRVSRHGPPLHPRAVPLRHRPARHAPRHEGIVWGIATGCMVPTRRQDSTHAIHGTLSLIAMAPSNFSMPIHLVSLATLAGHHRELSHDPLASAHGTGIFHFCFCCPDHYYYHGIITDPTGSGAIAHIDEAQRICLRAGYAVCNGISSMQRR